MAKVWPPQGDDSPSFGFKAVCCCEVHGPPVQTLQWQNKSALSAPCGFPGNSGGTHYYKAKAWTGSLTSDVYDSCDEGASLLGSQTETYGGSHTKSLEQKTYDPGDGSPVQHFVACDCVGDLTYNGDIQDDEASCTDNPIPTNGCPDDNTSGDDFNQLSGSGDAHPIGDGGFCCVCTGTAREQWSDETFFQDNIDACDSQPWDGTSFDPANEIFWVTSGDTFLGAGYSQWFNPGWATGRTYDPGRFRYRQNHLIPGHEYTFSIEAWRAAYDGVTPVTEPDFSLFATIEVVATADGDGWVYIEATDIPNADGFITMLKFDTQMLTPS